jgi:hypothetical protein
MLRLFFLVIGIPKSRPDPSDHNMMNFSFAVAIDISGIQDSSTGQHFQR